MILMSNEVLKQEALCRYLEEKIDGVGISVTVGRNFSVARPEVMTAETRKSVCAILCLSLQY